MDEHKLREAIAGVWGEYGAHVEVFDMMSKHIATLESQLAEAQKKAEALDRLEEMKNKDIRWELLGGDGSCKVYHPVIVTSWHDTITDAITEAYERTRP